MDRLLAKCKANEALGKTAGFHLAWRDETLLTAFIDEGIAEKESYKID